MDILNINDGIDCVVDVVMQSKEKPAIIAVEGFLKDTVYDFISKSEHRLKELGNKGISGEAAFIRKQDLNGKDYLLTETRCLLENEVLDKTPHFRVYVQKGMDNKNAPCFLKKHVDEGRYNLLVDTKMR